MLVTDVGDEMCIGHQHPLSFYISIGYQDSKDVINIEIQWNLIPQIVTNFNSPASLSQDLWLLAPTLYLD